MAGNGARRLWFQIHKWIGLALMVLLVPISLSGSVLLAHDWLEEEEGVSAPMPPLPLSRYVEAARPLLPGDARISAIALPTEDSPAVTVEAMRLPKDGEMPRRARPIRLAFDPATARPVPADEDDDFFEGTLHRFHGSLLIPVAGRPIVGWLGIAMLVSCISGIWLWWPSIGRWTRGLRWRRGRDWDFNLHHQVGFWIALPLAVLSLTGAWIAFPGFFSTLVGEQAPRRGEHRPAVPLAAPHLSIDAVAKAFAPGGGVGRIVLPTTAAAVWTGQAGEEERARRLLIDDATGRLAAPDMPRQGPVMRAMRVIHDGDEDAGPVWRLIAILGGIAPTILAVTGITMWLRSRRWRGKRGRS